MSTTGGFFFSFLFLIFAASVDYQMRSRSSVPRRRIKMIEKLAWQLPAAHDQWKPVSRPSSVQAWQRREENPEMTKHNSLPALNVCWRTTYNSPMLDLCRLRFAHTVHVNNMQNLHWFATSFFPKWLRSFVASEDFTVYTEVRNMERQPVQQNPLKERLFFVYFCTCGGGKRQDWRQVSRVRRQHQVSGIFAWDRSSKMALFSTLPSAAWNPFLVC